jgi:lysophospholipase L1-like esterase
MVKAASENSLGFLPSVVLINAGTNDCVQDLDIPDVKNRMASLIDNLRDNISNVTIILSTLLPNANTDAQPRIDEVNGGYEDLVNERRDLGQKMILAQMDDGFITVDDLVDGTHPNDYGYTKMAAVWYHALVEAEEAGYLSAPADSPLTNDEENSPDDGEIVDPGLPAYEPVF